MQRIPLLLLSLYICLNVGQPNGWKMVWSDEFDGNTLNRTKWSHEVNCWGGGNGELQCYTARAQNSKVENGNLVITAIPERYTGSQTGCTGPAGCTETRDYTSARLRTINDPLGSWQYGRFEMRAQLPKGKHLWPAFWMLPTDYKYGVWAASGEIDIMEFRAQVGNKVEGTLHFGGAYPNNRYEGSGPFTFPFDFNQAFHLFAVEWERDEIRWFVDDRLYHRMTLVRSFYSGVGANPYTANRQPFDQRFHLLLNLAVGGGFFPVNQYGTLTLAEARAWEDATFKIDYIRVYERIGNPATPIQTSLPVDGNQVSTSDGNQVSTSVPKPSSTSPINGENANEGQENNQSEAEDLFSKPAFYITTAVCVGIIILTLVVLIVFFVVRTVRRRKRSDSATSLISPVSSLGRSMDVEKSTERTTTPFQITVGMKCKAKYSGDSLYYNATVEEINGSKCLVNYGIEFGEEKEWLPISDISKSD